MNKCACGLPAKDTTICPRCTYNLERDLAEIPSLVDQLDITLSRQTAATHHDGGRSAETALPFNLKASEARENLHATLTGWVRDIHDGTEFRPADETPALSRWLFAHLNRIRIHPTADQLHDEISYAVAECRRAVDRPKNRSRVFVGACLDPSCDGELHAHFPLADYDPDDETTHARMTCTECEVIYAAEQWLHVGARLLRRSA